MDAYFIYVFTIVLTSFVATGIAFALSSTFKERAIATIVSGLIYILSMVSDNITLSSFHDKPVGIDKIMWWGEDRMECSKRLPNDQVLSRLLVF